ncbi:MAG: ABC transporter permease [Rikenellaceae bacterium]|nr:ABC transporter permease [Rikenellaceae bacterium]
MNLKDIVTNDYFKLFVIREGKVVLGKRYSSLWLLSAVLTATFLAVAFSNASLDYLSYKMEDPFINWVDIENNFGDNNFDGLKMSLDEQAVMEQFHYSGYQADKYNGTAAYFTVADNSRYLKTRYFAEINTPLMQAILNEDNIMMDCCIADTLLNNNSYGVIITYEALFNKLGYKQVPAYINFHSYTDPEAEYDLGVEIFGKQYAKAPIPVLAVVKRLPGNMDVVGTKYFYNQERALSFNMYEPYYWGSFIYFVPENVDVNKVQGSLEELTSASTEASFFVMSDVELPQMMSHSNGKFVQLCFDYEEDIDYTINKEIDQKMMELYADKGVQRVFQYTDNNIDDDPDDYISIYFEDLHQVGAFQEYAKENFKIDIEMSQINAKENFNEVSIMANILSWTMIVFAIVCIILFIVNLLQSYFQKVKRNLGTFKAFGISNYELIIIYVLIMTATVVGAVVISLSATWLIEGVLPLIGLQKDAAFGYLALWNGKTLVSVLIIISVAIATVYLVMNKQLRATPGDLIYDR